MDSRQAITPELREWLLAQVAAGHRADRVLASMQASGWDTGVALDALRELMPEAVAGLSLQDGAMPDLPEGAGHRVQAHDRQVDVVVAIQHPRIVVFRDLLSDAECEALIERINKHPLNNKCLFMFNGINDKSLEYAYSNARALVFPSYAEGFGLPLVEAMQRGLPAMASDIPVFREIGGDFMAYFDLNDPQTLAAHIRAFEATGEFPAARPVTEWQWVDWNGAAQQLISGTLSGIRRASSLPVHATTVAHADSP